MNTEDEYFASFLAGIALTLLIVLLIMGLSDSVVPNEMCASRGFPDTITAQDGTFYCVRAIPDGAVTGDAIHWRVVDKYCTGDGLCYYPDELEPHGVYREGDYGD